MVNKTVEKCCGMADTAVLETTFGRIGVTNAQVSWLAQVGRGALIGQEHVSLRGKTCKTLEL